LQDWLERFLPFLQQQGALVFIAGRKTGYWQAQSLERFETTTFLSWPAAASRSKHIEATVL
jgi:hypothetical protein